MDKYSIMREKIEKILNDYYPNNITTNFAIADEILALFSVSKRFNFPNFIAGVMVGITICIIIVELAL